MSLITRCPACQTMFKVVPDQLRISDGWVRCGQCSEIFDAAQQLLPNPTDPVATAASSGSAITADTAAGTSALAAELAAEVPADPAYIAAPPAPFVAPAPAPSPAVADAWMTPAQNPRDDAALVYPARHEPGDEPLWAETIDPEQAASPLPPRPPAEASSPAFQTSREEAVDPQPSFMKSGQKMSVWRRPAVRIVLLLLVLLLLAALAAQILVQERDRIASIEPSAQPLLLALCARAGCELQALRQIESIVIDSSSFTRVHGDTYRLGFSLRNNAAIDLAMPAIELALTDSRDQAVLRRVILPREFGAASKPLGAGSDWSSSLALSVRTNAGTDRIAGYRLLAFYP